METTTISVDKDVLPVMDMQVGQVGQVNKVMMQDKKQLTFTSLINVKYFYMFIFVTCCAAVPASLIAHFSTSVPANNSSSVPGPLVNSSSLPLVHSHINNSFILVNVSSNVSVMTNSSTVSPEWACTAYVLPTRVYLRDGIKCGCFDNVAWSYYFTIIPEFVDMSSPWWEYLTHVYGSRHLPCPFALANNIELLYLDLLPTIGREHTYCRSSVCRGWLARDNAENHVRRTGMIMHDQQYNVLIRSIFPLMRVPDNSWVEIWRRRGPMEGVGYGCWAYRAKGSGIFVNSGKVLEIRNKGDGYRQLGSLRCGDDFWSRAVKTQTSGRCAHDFQFAHVARSRGFDSIHMGQGDETSEFIMAHGECIEGSGINVCLPTSIDVRGGWNATRRSSCNATEEQAQPNIFELYS